MPHHSHHVHIRGGFSEFPVTRNNVQLGQLSAACFAGEYSTPVERHSANDCVVGNIGVGRGTLPNKPVEPTLNVLTAIYQCAGTAHEVHEEP